MRSEDIDVYVTKGTVEMGSIVLVSSAMTYDNITTGIETITITIE